MKKTVAILGICGIVFSAQAKTVTVDNFPVLTALQEAMQRAVMTEVETKLKKEWENYTNTLLNQVMSYIDNATDMAWGSVSCLLPTLDFSKYFSPKFQIALNTPCANYTFTFGKDIQLAYEFDLSDLDTYKLAWKKTISCEENPNGAGCVRYISSNRNPLVKYAFDDDFKKKLTFLHKKSEEMIKEFNSDVKALSAYQSIADKNTKNIESSVQQVNHRLRLADQAFKGTKRLEPIPSKEFFDNLPERQRIIYSYIADKQIKQDKYLESMYNRIKSHYSTLFTIREAVFKACNIAKNSNSGGTDQSARLLIPVECEKAKIELEKAQILLDQLEVQVVQTRYMATQMLASIFADLKKPRSKK